MCIFIASQYSMKPYLVALAILLVVCNKATAQHAVFDSTMWTQSMPSDVILLVKTADINGDGRTDIVSASSRILLWLQKPDGTMAAPQDFFFDNDGTNTAMNLAISDLDKDGKPEILILNYKCLKIYKWDSGTLVMADSIGDVGGAYQLYGLTTADFDNDGFTDIAFPEPGDHRLVVMYHNTEATTDWDIHRYNVNTRAGGSCYLTSGMFCGITQPAIAYVDDFNAIPVSAFTFGTDRKIKKRYDLNLPVTVAEPIAGVHSLAIVQKGAGKPAELWVTYEGAMPRGKVAVWRGLQTLPDTFFNMKARPGAIAAGNMDCDEDDEVVVLHNGWDAVSVITDVDTVLYPHPRAYISSYYSAGVCVDDLNSDGRADICFASWPEDLYIMYNKTTPCWPTDVTSVKNTPDKLTVYPNPAGDVLHISFATAPDAPLYLSDMTGRVVLRSQLKDDKAQVDVSTLANGQYILRIGNNSAMVNVER
jgi:hypothetical protein